MSAVQSTMLAAQQGLGQGGAGRPSSVKARQRAAHNLSHKALWHSKHLINRFPTDILGIQRTHGGAGIASQLQLLVVPGNPGLASFYSVFMQQLHQAFGGRADVLAMSHVGHDADNITRGRVWGLDDQVQHKAAVLQDLMLLPNRPPTVILAHSIGSYITLQVWC